MEADTKVIKWMASAKDMAYFIFKMVEGMKVNGNKIKWTDLENCIINLEK